MAESAGIRDVRRPIPLRLRGSTVEWLDGLRAPGQSRSGLMRDLIQEAAEARSRKTRIPTADSGASPLTRADDAELRWWRQFAERTAVNGDPLKTVEPGIELPGWTFMIIPSRDEHLDTA